MGSVRWTARLGVLGGLDEARISALPASHGVVCITDISDGVIALASTGDMRSFVAQRLGPSAEGVNDLRQAAAACELAPAGSMFEADLHFMDAAREREPGLHDRVTRKLRVWWLGTQRDAPRFAWSWATDPATFAPGSAVIGPFLEKSGARRHAEMLDGRFDLCRYPEELHRAPKGRACVYKQMGRCPGACEGSESTGAFEARLGEALAYNAARAGSELESLDRALREAVLGQAFERASEIKSKFEALALDMKRGLHAVRALESMAFVGVATGAERGRVGVIALDRGRWERVGDISGEAEPGEVDGIAKAARDWLESRSHGADGGDLGVLGVLSRELMRPSRGGPVLIERDRIDGATLLHAARRVLRITPEGTSPANHTRKPTFDE